MSLSIVVPLLNEAVNVPRLARRLLGLRERGAEVLVVDGGSDDGSGELLRASGLRVLDARRGRASQMNVGAAAASSDALVFLHADTELPPQADQLVEAALADGDRVWGRFDVRIAGRSPLLRLVAFGMNLRSRVTGIATGDQAIFVTRQAFASIGGYPDQPLMEDLELSRRLLALSRPRCLRAKATTSGRRWESRGVCRTIVLMWQLRFAYWRGAAASELAKKYR